MSEFVSRGDFLAPCPRRYGTFQMPTTGQTVRYRSLSEAEFSDFEMALYTRDEEGLRTDDDRHKDMRGRLIILCVCDAAGERILNDGDVAAIGQLDAGDTGALYDVLREHCGLARRVRDAQLKREAAKKNLNGTPAATSASG